MRKKTIVCIVGGSGSGKTMLARYMQEEHNIPTVVSYTTRLPRSGEADGVDHIFVDHRNVEQAECLAYTVYGEHEYWTEPNQVESDVTTYVIDEAGTNALKANFGNDYNILTVYIDRPLVMRAAQVGMQRVQRDKSSRVSLNGEYDLCIDNSGMNKKIFLQKATEQIMQLLDLA